MNAAAKLLVSGLSVVEAARELARRYAELARDSGPMEVPKPKVVFTVELPTDVVQDLRRRTGAERRSSDP